MAPRNINAGIWPNHGHPANVTVPEYLPSIQNSNPPTAPAMATYRAWLTCPLSSGFSGSCSSAPAGCLLLACVCALWGRGAVLMTASYGGKNQKALCYALSTKSKYISGQSPSFPQGNQGRLIL